MSLDPLKALPWLQLLDVLLAQVDQVRQNMNSGVVATKEQFAILNEEFNRERERVGNIVANMPAEDPPGTKLLG